MKRQGLEFMVFNTTFNNISVISWRSVLLVEETGSWFYCKKTMLSLLIKEKKT